jgi:uncharacterized UBP type Zn finger protein
MNSVLQAVIEMRELIIDLKACTSKGGLVMALQLLLGKRDNLDFEGVRDAVKSVQQVFATQKAKNEFKNAGKQNDAEEFVTLFVDTLDSETTIYGIGGLGCKYFEFILSGHMECTW